VPVGASFARLAWAPQREPSTVRTHGESVSSSAAEQRATGLRSKVVSSLLPAGDQVSCINCRRWGPTWGPTARAPQADGIVGLIAAQA